MEDLYKILQCDPQSSEEDIRQSYLRLALLYHPDKFQTNDGTSFVKIQRAYQVLSDPTLRKEFDVRWKDRCLIQDLPIQEEVEFSDFEFDEENRLYIYLCRCGSEYAVTEMDARLRYDIVCCETCSLTIRVLYDELPSGGASCDGKQGPSQNSDSADNDNVSS
ncbi:hypothetical protein BaRGS_00018135 [Batillaria attramentaria]|uniref:Diphthamide biosynthesis protein 4 n=1 Tax=Batillaria attramentaria TaxID=370345 RepID=A0ABD0KTX5_9CAEN